MKESAQERLIVDAMRDTFPDTNLAVRSVRISPDLYGYDLNAVMAQMVAEIIRVKDFEWIELV